MPHVTPPLGAPCWFELPSSDPAASQAFYAALFGWQPAAYDLGEMGAYTFLRNAGGTVGALCGLPPGAEGAPSFWGVYFGVADLEGLARDTHKFESRYLDRLIGPYPARRDLYIERSPVHHVSALECPVIFFQGLEDKVVPPSQAEEMVAALRAKGMPVAYVAFEGEQHGFRKAENIKRALDGECFFYSRVFGFTLADPVEPVPIENL